MVTFTSTKTSMKALVAEISKSLSRLVGLKSPTKCFTNRQNWTRTEFDLSGRRTKREGKDLPLVVVADKI